MLQIGGIKIEKISGPVSFCILKPTQKFLEFAEDDQIPMQILLGDEHYSFEHTCGTLDAEHVLTTNSVIVSNFAQNWFRLLDSICTEQHPIDYFIESFVPFKELQKPNKQLMKIAPSVMTYIAQHHIPCFSREQKEIKRDKCLTKNIRYHMAEVRWSINVYHYESNLASSLLTSCFEYHRDNSEFLAKFKQAVEKPEMFFTIFFDFNNINLRSNSLIWKQLLKQRTGAKGLFKWIQFITRYYGFVLKSLQTDPAFAPTQQIALECLQTFDAEQKTFQMYSTGDFTKCDPLIEANKAKYQKAIRDMQFYLTLPFIDIYYLLRSWKYTSTPRQWCNVFNAGHLHTFFIQQFLVTNKFFEIMGENINKTSPQTRCLTFTKHFSLDQFVPGGIPKNVNLKVSILGLWMYWNLLNGTKIKTESLRAIASFQHLDPQLLLNVYAEFTA